MRTPHGERLFTVIGIPIDVTRYRPDAWLDDTPASGTAQRQGPWDRSTSVSDNVTMPLRRYSLTAPYHVQRSTFACRQVRTIYNSWRVDGCSTGFQRPLMDSQWWWVRLVLYRGLHIIKHFKESHHGHETAAHHTTVGGGCCRGRDRRRTDGFRSRSAVLQRERLGNRLPVARQRSDQDFPAPCSVPRLWRPSESGQ